jgi:hypothetical protein
MHALARRPYLAFTALLALVALSPLLNAQDAMEDGPPNVLVIHREYLKPGKGGALHDRSESAFVRAFAEAKSPYHYFALDSLSGPSRSLFLFGYNSFADWEKETAAIGKNKDLAAKVDHASLMDGDLLAGYDASALMLRSDLSLNKGTIEGARYFEIVSYVVKPGHTPEFEQLNKMYIDTYRKVAPETRWDTFQALYGNPAPGAGGGDVFLVIMIMKSLAETDKGNQDADKFATELGAAGLQKLNELTAASVETTTTNLFAINPRMSNPPSEWIKKDPSFWKIQ